VPLPYTSVDEAVVLFIIVSFFLSDFLQAVCYLVLVSMHEFSSGFCLFGWHFAHRSLDYGEDLDSTKRKKNLSKRK